MPKTPKVVAIRHRDNSRASPAPKKGAKNYDLKRMLARITLKNLPEEISWGPPVGKEIW